MSAVFQNLGYGVAEIGTGSWLNIINAEGEKLCPMWLFLRKAVRVKAGQGPFQLLLKWWRRLQTHRVSSTAGADMETTAEFLWLCFLGCIIHTATEADIHLKETSTDIPDGLRPVSKRISEGFPCPPFSPPWVAVLFDNYVHYCSGVLVHPQWVLSAAHCWKPSYTIGLGLRRTVDWYKPGTQMIKANFSVKHPQYVTPRNGSDLMLIKLNRPVRISDTIWPIFITSECPTPGTRCWVTGWGQLLDDDHPLDLRCALVPVVSEQHCRFMLNSSYHDRYFPLDLHCAVIPVLSDNYCRLVLDTHYHESIFCTVGEGSKDACQFDSGGPLICNGLLQGLVSWGSDPCGIPGFPGFYTNLCKFKEWIREVIRTR
ncbi:PREDICTED: kallikrein-4-like [Chinchilla lanigera]|uniref:kallikrein-4-like n=1 Tax=Chinchilla lanigera TaxID=34839 RepID=UPI0006968DBF|nr:PREDICTED: kallikrein-4-like [Chinchilla lanigera]